ncbi:MAG: hypothetical protein KJ941_05390, partial [Bacteroidetes bacterium]|nr:hypothetical protein [Bacteroidota bacterium]
KKTSFIHQLLLNMLQIDLLFYGYPKYIYKKQIVLLLGVVSINYCIRKFRYKIMQILFYNVALRICQHYKVIQMMHFTKH